MPNTPSTLVLSGFKYLSLDGRGGGLRDRERRRGERDPGLIVGLTTSVDGDRRRLGDAERERERERALLDFFTGDGDREALREEAELFDEGDGLESCMLFFKVSTITGCFNCSK